MNIATRRLVSCTFSVARRTRHVQQVAPFSSSSQGGGGSGINTIRNITTFAVSGGMAYGLYYTYNKYYSDTEDANSSDEAVKPQAEITKRVFFDVAINGQPAGRITMGLYGSVVPKTVRNFELLCAGTERNTKTGQGLAYEGSSFHRIIPGFMCQVRSKRFEEVQGMAEGLRTLMMQHLMNFSFYGCGPTSGRRFHET